MIGPTGFTEFHSLQFLKTDSLTLIRGHSKYWPNGGRIFPSPTIDQKGHIKKDQFFLFVLFGQP